MNSIFLPAQVSVLLRRLVNIVSTLSVSNHYLLQRKAIQLDASAIHTSEPIQRSTAVKEHQEASGLASADIEPEVRKPPAEPPRSLPPSRPEPEEDPYSSQAIRQLMNNPVLYDPMRAPRFPIALCHGLYGFDVRGPSIIPALRYNYWSNVLEILNKKIGAEVIITSVPPTGSIASRAESLDKILKEKARGRGINLMAHSMGGLDCRHLISHIRPREYHPLSLTTVNTPHRGSAFMDWCAENLGLGRMRQKEKAIQSNKSSENDPGYNHALSDASDEFDSSSGWEAYAAKYSSQTHSNSPPLPPTSAKDQDPATRTHATSPGKDNSSNGFRLSLSALPSSFTALLLSVIDSPAYANLTTAYLNEVFNPATPDSPEVKYYSVTSRVEIMSVWHPLWLPKMVLDGSEEKSRADYEGRYGRLGEDIWGNDGLVSVQSAKWGEFLGVLEGCDHWEVRGARGIDLNRDLLSQRSSLSDNIWGIKDWGKFVGAFKKAEAATGDGDKKAAMVEAANISSERTRSKEKDGDALKSATDKLSAVFDWLLDQVPAPPKLTSSGTKAAKDEAADADENKGTRNDLRTKADLEKFYVALARNLYNNGL